MFLFGSSFKFLYLKLRTDLLQYFIELHLLESVVINNFRVFSEMGAEVDENMCTAQLGISELQHSKNLQVVPTTRNDHHFGRCCGSSVIHSRNDSQDAYERNIEGKEFISAEKKIYGCWWLLKGITKLCYENLTKTMG